MPSTNDNGAIARSSYAGISLLCMLVMAALFGTHTSPHHPIPFLAPDN